MADPLAAAKAAALLELFGPGSEKAPESKPAASSKKRPRSTVSINDGGAEPEDTAIADGKPVAAAIVPDLPDDEKEQYSEILEAMQRFAERGTAGDEEMEPEASDDTPPMDEAKPSRPADTADEKAAEAKGEGKSGKDADKASTAKSRREKKLEARNLIARLKALAERPEVVDAWDVSARDPLLLVHMKSWPNSVPVPANWRQKRKYLQNKRGMEKRVFQLPAYIADTGIGALRDAQLEADDKKTLKQKQREKMRAKTGRGVEIDEVVMHDAFFKFQTKPRLSRHGDLYYELRELEVDYSAFKPGIISAALRAALGIAPDDPPPWLVNMQRYGPPPGYPGLKVPGLNAPIPHGAKFGYQPGGWGKPPVDASGQPVYGDVFGEGREYQTRDARFDASEAKKKKLWGALKTDTEFFKAVRDEEAKEEVEEADKGEEGEKKDSGTKAPKDGVAGTASVQIPALEAPADGIELRKGVPAGVLYSVLPEKRASVGRADMLGSAHVYDVSGGSGAVADGNGGNGDMESEKEKSGMETRDRNDRKRRNVGKESERSAKAQKSFKF